MWNLTNGKCKNMFLGFTDTIHNLKILPNGDQACLIKVWSFYGQGMTKCLRLLRGHTDSITCVIFSLHGDFILSGSSDKTIKMWSLADGVCIKTMVGHTNCVLCLEIISSG